MAADWKFDSYVVPFTKQLQSATGQGIAAASLHLQNKDKVQLSVSGWGKGGERVSEGVAAGKVRKWTDTRIKRQYYDAIGTRGKNRGKKVRKFRKVLIKYGPSISPESPHLHKGTLRQSVTTNINRKELWGRVGIPVNTKYGFFLEVGTKRIKQRPWMVKTLREELNVLKNLICARF